jgi:hypothetical protein
MHRGSIFLKRYGASLSISNLDPHMEWLLLPQDPGLLILPSPGVVLCLEIKLPEGSSQDKSHLEVGEVAA